MADTLDVVTLAEAKDAVGVDPADSGYDTELARSVTAVSRKLDQLCGPVVVRTVTTEEVDGDWAWVRSKLWPADSFTTVRERSSLNASWTTLTATTDYLAEKYEGAGAYTGRLNRVSAARFARWVELTYSAGRYANTSSVDEQFKEAAWLMLRVWWQSRRPSFGFSAGEFAEPRPGWPTFAVPQAVVQLLGDEARRTGFVLL